jgi:uroporphyrinogen decarboxylase
MDCYERCAAAISWQKPDRVPVIPQNSDMAMQHAGYSLVEGSSDGEMLADALIKAQKEYKFDGIMLGPDAAILAEAVGCETEYRIDNPPAITGHILEDLDDIDKLKSVDIYKDGRMFAWIKATKILKKEYGNSLFIISRADQGAFDMAALIYGMDKLAIEIALGEKNKQIHSLLEYGLDIHVRFAAALKDAGADMVTCGDSYSGPALIGPAYYKQFSFPYEKRAVEQIEDKIDIPYSIHICGNTDGIHNIWPETGATVFEIDHLTNIESLRKVTLGKTALLGNLDTGMLCTGTPSELDTACKELLELMLPDSGFILSSGCSMSGNSSPELLHVMVECAKKYGKYK